MRSVITLVIKSVNIIFIVMIGSFSSKAAITSSAKRAETQSLGQSWKFNVNYTVANNLSDLHEKKIYAHDFSGKISYQIQDVQLGIKSGFHYSSLNSEINDDSKMGISSTVITENWNYSLRQSHALMQNFSQAIASEEFQKTGAKGASSFSLGLNDDWNNIFSTQLLGAYTQIWNEYEHPLTAIGYNIDHTTSLSTGIGIKILKSLDLGFSVNWSRYYSMDEISNDDISYSTSASGKVKFFQYSLSYTEGGAVLEENTAYLFTSDRRKILSLTLGWSF